MNKLKCALLSLSLFAIAGSAHAYTFYLDDFAVWKNYDAAAAATPAGLLAQTPIFGDTFDDGSPPPSAPDFTGGGAAEYAMFGSMGPEATGAPGILTLDSADTADNGYGIYVQQAILKTNVVPASPLGLKEGSTNFLVGGIFNFINPGNANGAYGVRFTDLGAGNGNDIVSLVVRGSTGGQAVIEFASYDYTTGVRSLISQQVLDTSTGYGQIALGLAYQDPDGGGQKAVYAGYFYLDGGTPTATFFDMAGSADLFTGENFTRAAFFAADVAPVPEPGEYALMLAGLGLVVWKVRRNRA